MGERRKTSCPKHGPACYISTSALWCEDFVKANYEAASAMSIRGDIPSWQAESTCLPHSSESE